jgi:hypothetical protein
MWMARYGWSRALHGFSPCHTAPLLNFAPPLGLQSVPLKAFRDQVLKEKEEFDRGVYDESVRYELHIQHCTLLEGWLPGVCLLPCMFSPPQEHPSMAGAGDDPQQIRAARRHQTGAPAR